MSGAIILPLEARIAVAIVQAVPTRMWPAAEVDAIVNAVHDELVRELRRRPCRALVVNEVGRLQAVDVEVER